MSRPFSYNDENLTVIGNILFVHSHIPYKTWPGIPMCDIPPEVEKRIIENNNVAFVTNEPSYPVTRATINDGRFFATQDNYNSENKHRWIYCWYPLKDI